MDAQAMLAEADSERVAMPEGHSRIQDAVIREAGAGKVRSAVQPSRVSKISGRRHEQYKVGRSV
jgi:hypothetical protein